MTDDDKALVERLRDEDEGGWVLTLCGEAADRIEAQAAEIERLREALTTIRDRKWNTMTQGCDAACEAQSIARAALGETE
jgi:hypothetical protein